MKTLLTFTFALLLVGLTARAQSFSIDWHKVSDGGGASTGGNYQVTGTIGQPDAGGAMTDGNYSLTGGFWAVYAVQTPGAPLLTMSVSGANVILSWPTNATGFTLESTHGLGTAAAWTTNSTAPIVVNGQNTVTNRITGTKMFFRLMQ